MNGFREGVRMSANKAQALSMLTQASVAQVELDPDVFVFMLESLAEAAARPRRKEPRIVEMALMSYCEFYGLDPEAALEPQSMLEMAALASRLSALIDISEHVTTRDHPERPMEIAEAACAARLIEKDGKPAFQLLDFLAALARAEAVGRPQP
jgi:hypothetical protein